MYTCGNWVCRAASAWFGLYWLLFKVTSEQPIGNLDDGRLSSDITPEPPSNDDDDAAAASPAVQESADSQPQSASPKTIPEVPDHWTLHGQLSVDFSPEYATFSENSSDDFGVQLSFVGPSGQSGLNSWVKRLQLDSSVFAFKSPVHRFAVLIS